MRLCCFSQAICSTVLELAVCGIACAVHGRRLFRWAADDGRITAEGPEGDTRASLCSNLGMLGVFKYYNFFVELVEPTTTFLGLDISFLKHELLLPVGISFYTFQTMSYTIDLYRGEKVLEKDFLKFAVCVAFFPQLVAGPIVRAKQFLPLLHRVPLMSNERIRDGLLLVFRGLFKKIVIADLLGLLAV